MLNSIAPSVTWIASSPVGSDGGSVPPGGSVSRRSVTVAGPPPAIPAQSWGMSAASYSARTPEGRSGTGVPDGSAETIATPTTTSGSWPALRTSPKAA